MAFIVAIIVLGLAYVISALVMFRYGLSDNQSIPPSTAAERTFTIGTLIAFAIAASYWLQPEWWNPHDAGQRVATEIANHINDNIGMQKTFLTVRDYEAQHAITPEESKHHPAWARIRDRWRCQACCLCRGD
jgi:hypothetical protein